MKTLLKWIAIGWMSLFVLFFVGTIAAALIGPTVDDKTVIRLRLHGEIPELPADGWTQLLGGDVPLPLFSMTRSIRRAATDARVLGMVLDIQAPQIGFAQLEELESAMAVYRESGKWSVAFIETAGEMARGDGAYALAAMADRIVLAPSGEVNLFGLRAEVPFVKGTFDKLSIDVHVQQRHAYKNAANTYNKSEFTEAHRESIGAILDDLSSSLMSHIASRRSVSSEDVDSWISSSPMSAAVAKERGLVDELGYWDGIDSHVQSVTNRDDGLLDIGAYHERTDEVGSGPSIAVIYGVGAIVRGETNGMGGSDVGANSIARAFREARRAGVDGVLFRVDSPGGSWIGSDIARREVEVTREAGIPVVASMGNVAASGGYILSMGASKVVASPSTLTGSIGALAVHFALRRFFEQWLGVTFDVYETHPAAAVLNGLDPPTDSQTRRFVESMNRVYEAFVRQAAKDRGKTYDEIHSVARGRVWSGRQALDHGLIDNLGGMHTALALLKEEAGLAADADVSLEQFPKPDSPFKEVLSLLTLSARVGSHGSTILRMLSTLDTALDDSPQPVRLELPTIRP